MKLPKHINLTFEHNPHAIDCETAEQHFDYHQASKENYRYEFISDDDRKKCVKQNDVWACQWYPHTSVGFNCVAASSFELLLEFINKEQP